MRGHAPLTRDGMTDPTPDRPDPTEQTRDLIALCVGDTMPWDVAVAADEYASQDPENQ